MNDPHLTTAHPVELLAVTTGRVGGNPKVILTLRLKDGSFESTNCALSPQQARRLLDGLVERFGNSKLLKHFSSTDGGGKFAYERIMFDGPASESFSERTKANTEVPPTEFTE